jgi:hypothetical protein
VFPLVLGGGGNVSLELKLFPLVLGQCSHTIRDRLEASLDWNTINTNSDVLELLK